MSRLSYRPHFVLAAAAALLTAAVPDARAATIIFTSGATTLGGVGINVSAQFDFDPTNHKITLTLLNLQANPTSLNQLIAGVKFTVTGAGSSLAPTIASSAISTFNVDSNGNPTTISPNNVNAWSVSASGTQMAFCTVCASSYGHELLIGGPAGNGRYATAFKNTQNPFIIASNATYTSGALRTLDSSPSWVFNLPSMTASTNVADVHFDFGLTYGDQDLFLSPEPGPLVTMLGGLGLILLGVWKRKGRAESLSKKR